MQESPQWHMVFGVLIRSPLGSYTCTKQSMRRALLKLDQFALFWPVAALLACTGSVCAVLVSDTFLMREAAYCTAQPMHGWMDSADLDTIRHFCKIREGAQHRLRSLEIAAIVLRAHQISHQSKIGFGTAAKPRLTTLQNR